MRMTPAATKSLGFTRTSGGAVVRSLGRTLRPMGVFTLST
jgi:hypothetical protein